MPSPTSPCRARQLAATVRHRPRPARRERPSGDGEGTDRHQRNRRRLAACAASDDPARRLSLRNAVVADNLPLVRSVAGRMSRSCQLPFEDMVQVGSLGLIRAVEAFDPCRSVSLSTFAVPYIRGAIQHEIRDRQHLMRIPRQLWELRLQVSRLQESRSRQGLAPLGETALNSLLRCGEEVLRQTLSLGRVTRMLSLDAPPPRQGIDAAGADGRLEGRLIDHLAATASPDPDQEPTAQERRQARDAPQRVWLEQQLQGLDPVVRQLLVERFGPGGTWVELGRRHGLPARQAQRRHAAALERLRQAGGVQRGATSPAVRPAAMASTAPMRV